MVRATPRIHRAKIIALSLVFALIAVTALLASERASLPYCVHCHSGNSVHCSKGYKNPGITNIEYGGEVQEWTCADCHMKWNAPFINLHRPWGFGCTQFVYY